MRPLLTLVAALVLVGCSGSSRLDDSPEPPTPAVSTPEAAPSGSRDMAALEALYWQRREDAKTYTEADVAFMTGMIGHHAQALIMADMAQTNGASASVRRLAARIDNAQKDEIESMQRWLRDRGQPVPEVHIEGHTLMIHMPQPDAEAGAMDHEGMDHGQMDHGGMDHSNMPGMLSDAQLAELGAARGTEFDRLFLAYMIQHHNGAVIMVEELFSHDGAANDDGSFKLASDIQVDQRTEIARMQLMLDRITHAD